MICNRKVTADLLFDCLDKPKKGIDGGQGVLINFDDIDRSASTVAGAKVTDIVLKAGKTGIAVQWYKDLASANSSFAPSTEDVDGFLHNFLTRLANSSADNAERANELAGGRFVMVYETRYKGLLNAEAFKVAGWESGMKLSEMTNNTLENSGSTLFTLATPEGDTESYPYNVFLETSYDVSKATFDTLFVPVI